METLVWVALLGLVAAVGFAMVRMRGRGAAKDDGHVDLWASGRVSYGRREDGKLSIEPKIENVREGGVVKLRGLGPNLQDLDLEVIHRNVYDEEGFLWAELECEGATGKTFVTVEVDDAVEVTVTVAELDLGAVGLTPADLDEVWESETGSVTHGGARFRLDELGDADYYPRGDRSKRQAFRYWQYVDRDDRLISIERWGRGEFDVHLSVPVKDSAIEVYSLGGGVG